MFCHGGVINVWAAHVLKMVPRLFFDPNYTSIHRFLCARTGERNIVSLNETAHLRALTLATGLPSWSIPIDCCVAQNADSYPNT